MRQSRIAAAVALSVTLAACVQTRQFADVQFTPPQGDYGLLVLRPGGRISITDIVSAKQLSQSIVNDPKLWAA